MREKHRLFCLEYISNGYKAKDAYIKVYEASEKTADSNAYQLLKRKDVKEFLDQVRQDQLDAAMIDNKRWLMEVSSVAFAEKGDEIYNASEKMKALAMLQKYLGLDEAQKEIKQEVIEVRLVGDED